VHTAKFGDTKFHEFPTMNLEARAGLGTGFAIFSALFIFALIRIIIDEVERHKDINKKLIEARARMGELNMNIENIDSQYEDLKKNKGKQEDEDAKLIEKAA
jgi:hypothetical protein